ncbi:tetratricopeptide repeat protein [Dactylosporangium sp. NPDC000244]|uniref:tetratricopeptide repeat protein n=1 Tax=Dactylosporangium sp. NPDC000244 TaxID=3154365 RepID=UPI0033181E4C
MDPSDALGPGGRLRRHRLRAGVDQRELARRAGISVRGLRDIEQGRVRRPRAESVERLADALELSVTERQALGFTAAGEQPAREQLAGEQPAREQSAQGASEGTGREADDAKAAVHVGVLGTLSMRLGDAAVEVRSPMLRGLLGLLALHPRQAVSRDEIVDVLWDSPPRTCLNLVHVYVGQLRRLLEPDRRQRRPSGTIRLAAGGYRLDLDASGLDVVRFDELLARARRDMGDAAAREHLGQALDCWRGPVLAGADPRLREHRSAAALSRQRVDAAMAYADLALAADEPATASMVAVRRLLAIVPDEPLHEGLHARLARLLARTERAGALRLLADVRARLTEELGVQPGEELQAAQLHVLRQEAGGEPAPRGTTAANVVVPGQLLADVATFTGRADALRRLDALVDGREARRPPGATVVAIAGTAGIGKTALAMHWAHRVKDRFPDGQLYVNLRGYAQGSPLRPIEALARFVHALGTPPDEVPLDVDEAAAVYRTLLAQRRILVVLDNARDAEQVRPLLPGGVGCLAIVTSRDRLAGLVAREGAQPLALDVLGAQEARALLGRLLGAERMGEPAAADELVGLCGALPLALRIAAANLLCEPHQTIGGYVRRLRDGDRLTALSIDGDRQTAVGAALDLSYAALPDDARRVFRLLGLVPGPDFTAGAVTALNGQKPTSAAATLNSHETTGHETTSAAASKLERLARAHLIEESAPGRYAFHDLLRLYAQARGEAEDDEADRRAARQRLLDHYLSGLDAAARLLYPEKLRMPLPPRASRIGFADHAQALAWIDAEHPNLVAAVQQPEPGATTWLLADALRGYYHLRVHTIDWLTAAHASLAAALEAGDPAAEAVSHLSIADAHWRRSRHDLAVEHFRRGLAAARRTDWAQCQATILGNLGAVHWQSGHLKAAGEQIAEALELNRRVGWLAGQAVGLGNLGLVRMQAGQLAAAAGHFREALDLSRQLGSRSSEANVLGNLGEACQLLGRLDEAIEHLSLALVLHRELGGQGNEAANLRTLAATHRDAGRLDQALELAQAALERARGTDMLRLEIDAHNAIGSVFDAMGRHDAAVDSHERALVMARETGERLPEAEALIGVAAARRNLGELDRALADVMRALALTQRAGFHQLEGAALTGLAAVHLARGEPQWAVHVGERASAVHEKTGFRAGLTQTADLLREARAAGEPATRASGR